MLVEVLFVLNLLKDTCFSKINFTSSQLEILLPLFYFLFNNINLMLLQQKHMNIDS